MGMGKRGGGDIHVELERKSLCRMGKELFL